MQRLSIAILSAVVAVALATGASADTVTLFPSADSFIRSGSTGDDVNSGNEVFLRIQSIPVNRTVLRFDQAAIQSAVGAGTLQRAVLLLYVETSGNWGGGRNVDLHRLNANWSENGVTWNCPIAGCGTPWDGGDFNPTATATVLHTNELAGSFVQFDVTADVAAFLASTPNYGWVLKKSSEAQEGHARYTSRHGIGAQFPRLVLSYSGAPPTADDCDGAAPGNPCIPGGGAKASDCILEWQTMPVPPLEPSGLPKRKLTCWEGDPTCDADSNVTNKSCTFRVAGCINNTDPRLPTCGNGGLSTWQVKKPNPFSVESAVDGANLAALEGLGAGGFGATVLRRSGIVHTGSTNATPNRCSNFFDFVVPLKVRPSGSRQRTSRIRVRATTAVSAIDNDTLRLECRPSTCGNNVVEADHEECDDGNRLDGDNCNRGCRFEGPTPTPTLTRTPTLTKTQTGTPTPIGPTSTITETPTVTPTHTQSLCGNNGVDAGEECDDGAACFGGSNQGNPCTHNSQCPDGGECRAAGGDGCALNCTNETSVPFELTGAVCRGGSTDGDPCSFQSTCVGGVVPRPCATQSDCAGVGGTCTSECGASPSRGCFADGECTAGTNLGAQCYVFPGGSAAGTCNGGASSGLPCSTTSDCGGSPCDNPCGAGAPAGACKPKSRASLGGTGMLIDIGPLIGAQELRLGGPDANGLVPVASPANTTSFEPVIVPGLACACVRGATDPGIHGPNNSASGAIACGATPIANDVSIAIDHNTYPPQTCFTGPNRGMPCHNRCAVGGTRAGLPCAVTGANPTECPGGTTNAHRQCHSIADCGALNACNTTNGPGMCLGGQVSGRVCLDSTQCLGGGSCMGRCTAGTVVGALCSCETGTVCPNPGDCGTDGVCRVIGGQGGGFCAGPARFCQGGSKAGFACYDPDECPGGTCPATGNFLGYCDSDSDCPGSVCASIDDSTTCALVDPNPPGGSGDAACPETFEICTAGPNLGADCSLPPPGDSHCGAGGECGSLCSARPAHVGLCNSPTRTRFSGAGGMGSALFLSTIQIGTISDGGSCATEKKCSGGANNGSSCQVNEDCPGGACASALCHGFCSIATTRACLVNADCPSGGGVCTPGATFNVPCTGTNPETECGANAVCRGINPAKGFDGVPCTADDPVTSQGLASTVPHTTGTSHASVSDSFAGASSGQQLVHKACYPSAQPSSTCITASSGTPFDCGSLLSMSPSASGVRLTTVLPTVDGITGDAAVATLLVAR